MKKNRYFKLIVFCSILLALFIGGYLYKTKLQERLALTDTESGFKEFKSEEYKFSFKYPAQWYAWKRDDKWVDQNTKVVSLTGIYAEPKPEVVKDAFGHPTAYAGAYISLQPKVASALSYAKQSYPDEDFVVLESPKELEGLDAVIIDGLRGAGAPGPELIVNTQLGVIVIGTEMVNVFVGTDYLSEENAINKRNREKIYMDIFSTFKLI